MRVKSLLFILIVGVLLASEAEGHLKLKLLKAKLIAAKAPHIAAKIAVAKEVKAKAGIAVAKSIGAIKAAKVAALSAITAPIRVAKKSLAIKIGAVKAVKALKLAKVAAVVGTLKKHPIIVPVPVPFKVPVPIPIKGKKGVLGAGALGAGALGVGAFGAGAALGNLNPVKGLISGAQNIIKSAGVSLPFLSTLSNGIALPEPHSYAVESPEPVYRFVPNAGFSNYNNVQYNPSINVEIPVREHHSASAVHIPHSTYGLPSF